MRLLEFDQLKPEKGIPYCRDHLRRLVDANKFPRPVNVSDRRIAWLETEIHAWIERKIRARDGEAA